METTSIFCCATNFCNKEDVYLEKPRCNLDAGSPNLEPKEPSTEEVSPTADEPDYGILIHVFIKLRRNKETC